MSDRRARNRTGFHRIGVVLATVPVLIGIVALYNAGANGSAYIETGVFFIACGALGYLAAIALGWIVSGFLDGA